MLDQDSRVKQLEDELAEKNSELQQARQRELEVRCLKAYPVTALLHSRPTPPLKKNLQREAL
jgi:hypothetical protein